MNSKHIKLFGLFLVSYLSVLLYPISYILSPALSTTAHQATLTLIVILALPVYALSIKRFGVGKSFLSNVFKYSFQYGRIMQKIFVGIIGFIIIGIGNAILVTTTTTLTVIPFALWNPLIEGGVLLLCLFSLILQVAIIQSYRDELPTEEEIENVFNQAEQKLKEHNENHAQSQENETNDSK